MISVECEMTTAIEAVPDFTSCDIAGGTSQTAASPADSTVARMTHSLDELQRLADLLAVDDDYEPITRDFVISRKFKMSVVIPVFNERHTIQQVLANVVALPIPKEVIVVDDASTDGTRELLGQYEAA